MTCRTLRRIRLAMVALTTGTVFASLTCVQTAAETLGSGLTFSGTSGVLGLGGPVAIAAGSGIEFLVDLARLIAITR